MAYTAAALATVRRQVYANLGISDPTSYGTLVTNERYVSGYIDDAIAEADLFVTKMLMKSPQYRFPNDFWSTEYVPSSLDYALPQDIAILSATIFTSMAGGESKANEITEDQMALMVDGGLFDIVNYAGYYRVLDGYIRLLGTVNYPYSTDTPIPVSLLAGMPITEMDAGAPHGLLVGDQILFTTNGTLPTPLAVNTVYYVKTVPTTDTFTASATNGGATLEYTPGSGSLNAVKVLDTAIGYVKYRALTHQSTLSSLISPASFESAIANFASAKLLMKRADNPVQSEFYMKLFAQEMSTYMSPPSNTQREVEN